MAVKDNFQKMVDEINKHAIPYCSKSLTIRETPDGETPEPSQND